MIEKHIDLSIKLDDMYTDATNWKTCKNESTKEYAHKLSPNKNVYSVVYNLNTERLKQVLSAALKEDSAIITDVSDYYFKEYTQEYGEMVLTDKVNLKEKQYFVDKLISLGFKQIDNTDQYVFNIE